MKRGNNKKIQNYKQELKNSKNRKTEFKNLRIELIFVYKCVIPFTQREYSAPFVRAFRLFVGSPLDIRSRCYDKA